MARFDTEERMCQLWFFADVVFYLLQNAHMATAAAWYGLTQTMLLIGTSSPVTIHMDFPNSCMQFQIDVSAFIHMNPATQLYKCIQSGARRHACRLKIHAINNTTILISFPLQPRLALQQALDKSLKRLHVRLQTRLLKFLHLPHRGAVFNKPAVIRTVLPRVHLCQQLGHFWYRKRIEFIDLCALASVTGDGDTDSTCAGVDHEWGFEEMDPLLAD